MRAMLRALLFLAVLSGSVAIHEYGHLVDMQANGVQVLRFTIGFGPTIWSHTRDDGVEFAIKPVLLGGYTESVHEGPRSMEAASRSAQFVIAIAGTFVNVCVGFVLVWLLVMFGAMGPPRRLVQQLERIPGPARPLVAAAAMSFGAWLVAPVRMAADYVRGLFGRTVPSEERKWEVEKGSGLSGTLIKTLVLAAAINVGLAEFNMLPFRPFDGGAATSPLIGAVIGLHAQAWYDVWSFPAILALVSLSFIVRLFRNLFRRSPPSE